MEMIRLGKSGLEVTKIGMGGIPIQRLTEAQAVAVIGRALDRGINWFDTANGYGTSEQRFGLALKSYDRRRIKVFTKGTGRTIEELRQQVELSFTQLQTDYIDLYQFHNVPDEPTWRQMQDNGTLDLIRRLRDQGRIRHIGASSHNTAAVLMVLDHPEIEVVQWPFNFIVEQDSAGVLAKCRTNDVGFIAMKPFAGGTLERADLCIRFLMQYPTVVADPGFDGLEQIDEVVHLVDHPAALTEAQRAAIDQLKKELGTRFCRSCGYCSPCEHGVSIISLMRMDSLIKRFSPEQVLSGWIAQAAQSMENCTDCGLCEKKCPYVLAIREGIRQGAALFEQLQRRHTGV